MKILVVFTVLLLTLSSFSQNEKEKKDSLLNYTDINGLKQGHWVKQRPNGNTFYEGYFIDDKPVGLFKRYHENGKLMAEMKHEKNSEVCRAKIYSESAKLVAEGKYIGRLKDSVWVYYSPNGKKMRVEVYENGKLNGRQKIYNDNGVLLDELDYVDGEMSGLWKQYYASGNKKFEIEYKDAVREGKYEIYHQNGKTLKRGQYVNGMEQNIWYYYDESGKLKYTVKYDKGKIIEDGGMMQEKIDKYEEMMKNKGKITDPANYMNDPEEYFRQSQKEGRQY